MKVNLLQRCRDTEKKTCELRASARDFHIKIQKSEDRLFEIEKMPVLAQK